MIILFVLALICYIVLYMAFANILTQALFGVSLTTVLPLIIMAISAAGAYLLHKVRSWLRFLPILLLPLCFWPVLQLPLSSNLEQNFAYALLLVPPCANIILTIALKKFSIIAGRLRETIKICALAMILPLGLITIGYAFLNSIFYFHLAIIYIGCAICILRLARADAKTLSKPKYIFINLAPVIGCLMVLLIIGSPQVLTALWQNIILPALMFIVRIAAWLISKLSRPAEPPLEIDLVDEEDKIEVPDEGMFEGTELPGFVLYIMGAVVLIAIAIFVIKKLRGRVKHKYVSEGFSETRSIIETASISAETLTAARPSLFTPQDPRLAVRYHYRRFLILCAKRGAPPENSDTSGDINAKNKATFPAESIARLRELYIKARYSEHPVASCDSKEAGDLVKGL